jgi:hypothetical protein
MFLYIKKLPHPIFLKFNSSKPAMYPKFLLAFAMIYIDRKFLVCLVYGTKNALILKKRSIFFAMLHLDQECGSL